MPDEGRLVRDGLLGLLELLASKAPARRFDEPPARARLAGASTETLLLLDRARAMALDVRGLSARHRQRETVLSAMVDTARELALSHDVDALLDIVARRARLLLDVDLSWVGLSDRAEDTQDAENAKDAKDAENAKGAEDPEGAKGNARVLAVDGECTILTVGLRIPPGGGVGHAGPARSAPLWTPDCLADERFPRVGALDDVIRAEGLRALMAVPLKEGEVAFGTLYVADRAVRHFTSDEIGLMVSLGDLAAQAIGRARLLDRAHEEISALERDSARARGSSSAARRLNRVHTLLIDMVLRGCDLAELASAAALHLGGPLMVRDAEGHTLAQTGGFPEPDEDELFRRMLDAHAERAPIRSSGGLWLCPATAGEEVLGTLFLAPGGGASDADRVRLLEVVAQSTAVLLRTQASAAAAQGAGRDELLRELLGDSPRSPKQLSSWAKQLGVALDEPHVVLVIRPDGGPQGRALVWAASYATRHTGLKTTDEGCLVLLLPGSDPSAAGRAAAESLSAVIDRPVTVGSAGPVTHAASVHRTFTEAERCLDAITALGSTGGSASPQDLGFLGLLLTDHPDPSAFIADTIGPVLDYDEAHATELARTLEAYFASGASPRRAAETLHVHANTVSRRLERITELLGPSWQNPTQSLEVQLALRLRRTRHTIRGMNTP
ncbi:helix-turn-helix domain-containing protein [Streptomyces phyllanthi]|uniref:GAF domain-containing protein n=1 Tax=Streptomyces phyllanthi TaxID=1803180 RepID=A0A5N8VW07_9ACTN|nr:helix-turn-helix domain-containing protein [Streptomyces phyllanthi]MPY39169.1 GAF domain-containing protein [Streptomyces phyllanthi]